MNENIDYGSIVGTGDGPLELLSVFTRLKQTKRQCWIDDDIPQPTESIADHCFRVVISALVLAQLDSSLDRAKLIEMASIHDCGKAVIDAIQKESDATRYFDSLLEQSGGKPVFVDLWSHFENDDSPEASAVHQLDKLEMILQAAEYERRYWKSPQEINLDSFFSSTKDFFVHPVIKRWADEIISSRPFQCEENEYTNLSHAVKFGIERAKTRLAWLKLSGSGGAEKDEDGAVVLLEERVKDKDKEAMWMLGVCNQYGIGTEQDIDRAQSLYKQSFDLGSEIGWMFFDSCDEEVGQLSLECDEIELLKEFLPVTPLTTLDLKRIYCIGTSEAKTISELLMNNCTITSLKLSDNELDAEGAKKISELLLTNTTLTYLSMRRNKIGNKGAIAIGESLMTNSSLIELYLDGNKIGDEGATKISESLMKNSSLTKLFLKHNKIGVEGAKKMSESLMVNSTLEELFLNENKIGDKGAIAIAQSLTTNTTLTDLDLENNRIGAEGAKNVCELLISNSSLREFSLASNNIGAGAKAISDYLMTNSSLITLDLSGSNIRDEEAKEISESLKVNSNLLILELGKNNIGVEGAKALSESLLINSSLSLLGIRHNNIGAEGAVAISESLMKNTALTSLGLGAANIGTKGAIAISESLMINTTLETLWLFDNGIGTKGATAIAESLMVNSTLTSLDLARDNIGDRGAKKICESLMKNTTLTALVLRGNKISDGTKLLCGIEE